MRIILVGCGNVGKEVRNVLAENGFSYDYIVEKDGIYDSKGQIVDEKINFVNYVDKDSAVFITVPSNGSQEFVDYYEAALKAGAKVITCEKSVLALHWDMVKPFRDQIRYSASVGGDSGMLNAISAYEGQISEIRAVVNGTLNYAAQRLAEGESEEGVYEDVVAKGFAEPGSKNFNEVVTNELKDVTYKAVILANHSGLYERMITPSDVVIHGYAPGKRCFVRLDGTRIEAGFMDSADGTWFPEGVNNVLYINDQKMVEGPGAGARATAERISKDFKSLTT